MALLYEAKKHKYDEYAVNPFQLQRIVESGNYRVTTNFYNEKVFGPPYKEQAL